MSAPVRWGAVADAHLAQAADIRSGVFLWVVIKHFMHVEGNSSVPSGVTGDLSTHMHAMLVHTTHKVHEECEELMQVVAAVQAVVVAGL